MQKGAIWKIFTNTKEKNTITKSNPIDKIKVGLILLPLI